jgi:CHAD domain-containing protein
VSNRADDIDQTGAAAGKLLVGALRASIMLADAALDGLDSPAARREGVRTTRRELKAVRAIAPLCRDAGPTAGSTAGSTAGATNGATIGASNSAIDGVLEFSTKTNQLLGPLRDRDTLLRSIHRIVERFADADTRRVARTVLVATLIFSESDRRDEAAYSAASIDRARRSMRSARAAMASLGDAPAFDPTHASTLLLRNFRACRAELDAALRTSDLGRLHECRKRATFLALALRPFEDEVSSDVRRMRARAKRLAAALGEDRDLALLDVELRVARAQLAGSPLASAIDDALRLARLESIARVEDAAAAFLRLGRGRIKRGVASLFGV